MVIIRNPFKLVHLRPYPPPVLTSSGGHWNTYSWQAGGMHPTGMLSCYNCYGITAIRTSIKIYNDILRTIHCNVTIIHTENIYKAVSDIFKGDAAQKQRQKQQCSKHTSASEDISPPCQTRIAYWLRKLHKKSTNSYLSWNALFVPLWSRSWQRQATSRPNTSRSFINAFILPVCRKKTIAGFVPNHHDLIKNTFRENLFLTKTTPSDKYRFNIQANSFYQKSPFSR